jgi:hypothetical protein
LVHQLIAHPNRALRLHQKKGNFDKIKRDDCSPAPAQSSGRALLRDWHGTTQVEHSLPLCSFSIYLFLLFLVASLVARLVASLVARCRYLLILQTEEGSHCNACQPAHPWEAQAHRATHRVPTGKSQGKSSGNVVVTFSLRGADRSFSRLLSPVMLCIRTRPQAVLASGAIDLVESATLVIRTFPRWLFAGARHDFLVD